MLTSSVLGLPFCATIVRLSDYYETFILFFFLLRTFCNSSQKHKFSGQIYNFPFKKSLAWAHLPRRAFSGEPQQDLGRTVSNMKRTTNGRPMAIDWKIGCEHDSHLGADHNVLCGSGYFFYTIKLCICGRFTISLSGTRCLGLDTIA